MNIESFYQSIGVMLEPAGTRWRSVCPFHKEKTASFFVYPDGGYHCFGCGAHGTAKDIQEMYDLDYRPYPEVGEHQDHLFSALFKIRKNIEPELIFTIEDLPIKKRFLIYDMFDSLFIDANALAHQVSTSLLDLVGFIDTEYRDIKLAIKKSKN